MDIINATGSHDEAKRLASKGAVRAIVLGRHAIVSAQAWDPITADSAVRRNSITARAVRFGFEDVEAEATPKADAGTQRLIDGLNWEPWPA